MALRLRAVRGGLAGVLAAVTLLVAPSPASADPSSLYQDPAPRPGPDILYEPAANAPQLQNTGNWGAGPILVSGTTAYRSGEFLYQDWIYDDSGALGNQVQNDPRADGDGFSRWAGTYLYPTNTAVYGNNAADLVELRVEPLVTSTAFRITLNTIKDSSVVGATIAIGGTPGTLRAWPYSANVRSPAEYFLTVHGTSTPGQVTADLRDAASGLPVLGAAPSASLDLTRRQITVTVPHTTWDPGTSVVRMAAGVGLWNAATNLYRVPSQNPSAVTPGGAQTSGSPPALFNVAFRDECQQEDPIPPGTVPAGCEPMPNVQHTNALSDPSWWRDHAQAHVLGSGTAVTTPDISPFFANVDFSKLAGAINDETNVPQTGPMNRIFASHFETEQGAVYTQDCNTGTTTSANSCLGWLRGQLQPYSIYVPTQPQPSGGYGLTLLLHSLAANYNQFTGSKNQSQFGERGPGSIVITAAGRGPDGWYYGYAASDTFEMWADVAANYTLDPEWTAISGYSMGGYATYKLGAQFPDLFAKGQPVVGPPGQGIWAPPAPPQPGGDRSNTNRMLASFRNVPFLIWNGTQDELVPVASAQQQADEFGTLGLRFEWDLFTTSDHFALAINDEYGPAASFLGTTEVDRNPPHVTYVYNPTMDFATGQLNANHAYWLSGVTLRNGGGTAPLGTIDVRSRGFGLGDPTPSGVSNGAGVLTGGQNPAMPYTSQTQTWGAAPSIPIRDQLDINATNVSSVTVNARRARVTCNAQKNIISDSGAPPPVTVNLVDCPALPTLSIADDSQAEGDAGTANQSFTVTLSGNTDNLPVNLHYQTANGTASSASDYGATSGDLSFGPGETTKTIDVPINGDTTRESDETFTVQISDVQFATPTSLSATGTITNDDVPYVPPTGATPVRVPLVPAYGECTSPDSTHGGGLPDDQSCKDPGLISSTAKLDGSAATGTRIGHARIVVCTTTAAPGCESLTTVPDVRLFGNGSDVVCQQGASALACPGGAGSDYDPNPGAGPYTVGLDAGTNSNKDAPTPICFPVPPNPSDCAAGADMTAVATIPDSTATGDRAIRVTDAFNDTPSTNDLTGCGTTTSCSGTARDQGFPVPVVCNANATAGLGSYCGVNTTANALVPGVVVSGKAAVVEYGEIQVFDAGPDGSRGNSDDELFAVQGIFVP